VSGTRHSSTSTSPRPSGLGRTLLLALLGGLALYQSATLAATPATKPATSSKTPAKVVVQKAPLKKSALPAKAPAKTTTKPATKAAPGKAPTKAASTPRKATAVAAGVTAGAVANPEHQAESSKADLKELQGRIDSLRKEVATAEESRADVADQLKDAEKGISNLSRDLRQLSGQRGNLQNTLQQLASQARELEGTLAGQRTQLEQLLIRQYMEGGEGSDSLRLLLNGDNPNQMARDLYYLSAVAKARTALLQQIGSTLKQKKALAEDTRNRETELAEVEAKQKEQHQQLLAQKNQRQATLAKISQQIESRRKEIGALQQDEKRLTRLIDGLSRIIAQQKARPPKPETKPRAPAERPAGSGGQTPGIDNDKTPDAGLARFSGDFARLKGSLRLPVRGTVSNRFGTARQEGSTWKGLFIRAAAGGDVHAVAAGRVVFADWMRGFGNLLILDHGDGYLTIYGNNESLYKHVGETVKPGEVVAVIGNSGGNPESGLYFELRHQGQPLDPLKWASLK
jgi:septal ring factor EnvC (AmiA/AmiB activator)